MEYNTLKSQLMEFARKKTHTVAREMLRAEGVI